jgi:hypothetical protein
LTRRVLRAIAIAIALGGAIDPAVTSTRRTRPEIAILTASRQDDGLARRTADVLSAAFTVVRGPYTAAAAVVAVGSTVPPAVDAFPEGVTAFAVLPVADRPVAIVESVQAPARAPLDARAPIAAAVRARGAAGRAIAISLHSQGAVIDRLSQPVTANDQRFDVALSLIPTAAGALPARVTAEIDGATGAGAAAVDLLVNVADTRWAVLFFDRRPSWMSTFVRRAVEQDSRFVATSRVVTSRGASVETGRAPGSLGTAATLSLFDAIVIGAPHELTSADVDGLESYLRRRGGSVVLLCDERSAGPFDRLTAVSRWATASAAQPAAIDADGARVYAADLAWPAQLPPGARAIAEGPVSASGTTAPRPIVWRTPVGAGRVIVSGALDAWRHRTHDGASFDRFWQTVAANAAAASPPPIAVTVHPAAASPGTMLDVEITLRDVALADLTPGVPIGATVTAAIERDGSRAPIVLWPDHEPGRFRGDARTPSTPGQYRVVAAGGGARAEAPVAVVDDAAAPTPDESALLTAWTKTRRGAAISAAQLAELPAALERSLAPEPRLDIWYPMRSAWWLAPFALALGAEWWWRRRHGLR